MWIFKCCGIELLFWTRTMDSISDACMGNDRMDRRNFKSEKMVGKQQDTVNDFWDSFRNFIFFCHGYLDTSGSFTFPLYPDKNRAIYGAFAKNLIPRSYLVDKTGKVVYATKGYSDEEFAELMKRIEAALK